MYMNAFWDGCVTHTKNSSLWPCFDPYWLTGCYGFPHIASKHLFRIKVYSTIVSNILVSIYIKHGDYANGVWGDLIPFYFRFDFLGDLISSYFKSDSTNRLPQASTEKLLVQIVKKACQKLLKLRPTLHYNQHVYSEHIHYFNLKCVFVETLTWLT